MPNILLIFDRSQEFAADLEQELTTAFGERRETVNITTSGNAENARQKLPGDFDLVITALHIRKNAKAPISPDDEEGVELLRWMGSSKIETPSILVAPSWTKKLQAAQSGFCRCWYFIREDADMVHQIVENSVQLVRDAPAKCLDVEIQLLNRTEWTYRMIGRRFAYEIYGRVQIDESMIDDLIVDAEAVAEASNWQDLLRRIGERMLAVMTKNPKFVLDVFDGLSQAGGEAHTRVRFVVPPEFHRLALEAVMCPRMRNQYWMLNAPVYRRLLVESAADVRCRFQQGGKINCLIIDATSSGLVSDLGLQLGRPTSVSDECDWIKRELTANQSRFNIADPLLLRAWPGQVALAQQVKETLESREWAIVHYAGHSHYDGKKNAGYVFFPGRTEGSIEKVDLARFSGWLRNVTFTYFSSCDSGAGPFVFGLADNKVANILGFRWEIDDPLAFEFAKEFYPHLIEHRSLERAFLKARQRMHELHPDDRIWAAPILIKQLSDS